MTANQIGASLGIHRTAALAALKKLPDAEREDRMDGDRHLYPWTTVVRVLINQLRIGKTRSRSLVPACQSGHSFTVAVTDSNQFLTNVAQLMTPGVMLAQIGKFLLTYGLTI